MGGSFWTGHLLEQARAGEQGRAEGTGGRASEEKGGRGEEREGGEGRGGGEGGTSANKPVPSMSEAWVVGNSKQGFAKVDWR